MNTHGRNSGTILYANEHSCIFWIYVLLDFLSDAHAAVPES